MSKFNSFLNVLRENPVIVYLAVGMMLAAILVAGALWSTLAG